jgi:hypothetical protein
MMIGAPVIAPLPPMPATILPKIKVLLDSAVVHITLLLSNTAIAHVEVILRSKNS